jgi:urease subunit gamma/beta
MHLTPHEQERLMIHVAADVVEKRLQRNPDLPLNYVEVMALLSAHVLEEARHGMTVAQVMASGRTLLNDMELETETGKVKVKVMSGVREMIDHVQVEATFPDGTKLVTISRPLECLEAEQVEQVEPDVVPGEVKFSEREGDAEVPHNDRPEDRVTKLEVLNDDDNKRPIQVGSHYHFFEANENLRFFDPEPVSDTEWSRQDPDNGALGMRLNVPAGSSVRFEHGDLLEVQLVPIKGERKVHGLRGLTEKHPIPDLDLSAADGDAPNA